MKTSQRFIVLLFIAFAFFASDNARASHATAGYITYTYLSPSTYEVILTFYRDCAGVLAPASASISYNSSCGGGGTVVLLPVPGTGQQIPLSPFTVPANTACMGGTGYGAEEWKYSGIVVLPIACSDWTFSYSLCCRNPSNTTVGTGNFYIETMLNNLNVPINNSPVPFSHAVAEFCVGDPAIWNQNSTDVDGDSLVYSLVCPKTDSNSSVVYNPPYSCTNPIIASPQVSLNPISGQMAFLPTVQQISILAVKVDEYRGGVLIGSVVNSMQVYVSANNLCLFNIGSNNLIVGKTFIDGNQNGVCDSNETGFTSGVANFTNQANSFNSGLGFGGLFFGIVDTGSWTSSIDLFNTNYFSVSPDSIISNFGSQTGLIDTVNFAVQMIPGNPDLSIELLPLTPPVPGFNLWYGLVATNIGTDTITGDVQFTHDSLLTINSTTPLYDSYTNPVVTWNFTDFAPFQTQTYTIWFSVPAPPIVNLGDKLNSSVIINPVATDVDPSNNIDSINHEVIGAYDPNDKWVNRETILSNALPYTDHLDYLIRFQNTGTDTAHTVIIRDTLDGQLDQSTFNIKHASHDYKVITRSNNVIEFHFDNILLPDSNVNEAASHGYIAYKIKPKSSFGIGNVITNAAAIYFDYNLPIITNTVLTEAVLFTNLGEHSNATPLTVYPNPTNGKITISAEGLNWEKANISVYDILGKQVMQLNVNKPHLNKYSLDISALAKGVYNLVVEGKEGIYSARVIIE